MCRLMPSLLSQHKCARPYCTKRIANQQSAGTNSLSKSRFPDETVMRTSLTGTVSRAKRLAERLRLSAAQLEESRLSALTDEQLWDEMLDVTERAGGIEVALEVWRQRGKSPEKLNELRQRWNRRMGGQ